MKTLTGSIWVLLLSVFLYTFPLAGQQTEKDLPGSKNSFWFNGGIGTCYFGPAFNWGLSYSCNQNIFSARYLKADEFVLGSPGGGKSWDDPQLKMKEVSILYGRSERKGILVLSLSGGLSYIDAVKRGGKISERQFEKVNIQTIGLPLELHVRIELTSFLGIGGSFLGNLNPKKSFAGGTFNLYLGKF